MFPSEDFFHLGKQKKVSGRDGVNREGGAWGSCWFWPKTFEHSKTGVGRCAHKYPHEMSKYVERVFKKNSLKPNTASHNNTSWYPDTDGFLEYSPSWGSLYYKGPALQKIILFLFGSPLVLTCGYCHRLNVCVPCKSIFWNLIPNMMVFGGGAFGSWLGCEGRALMNGIAAFTKEI